MAAFGLAATIFFLCLLRLYPSKQWSEIFGVLLLCGVLAYATNRAMRFGRTHATDVDKVSTSKVGFGVYAGLILPPTLLLVLGHFSAVQSEPIALLEICRLLTIVMFLIFLVLAARQIATTSGSSALSCIPLVASYASLFLLLGDGRFFGYLVNIVPETVLNYNESIRLLALMVILASVVVAFLAELGPRLLSDELEVSADWSSQRRQEPIEGLPFAAQIARSTADTAIIIVDALRYAAKVALRVLSLARSAAIAVVQNIADPARLMLGGALALQLLITLLVVSKADELPTIVGNAAAFQGFSLKELGYFAVLFAWMGLSLVIVSITSVANTSNPIWFGISQTLQMMLMGFWLFSATMHVLVGLHVLDIPGYRFRFDHAFLIFGALTILLMVSFYLIKNRRHYLILAGMTVSVATVWALSLLIFPYSMAGSQGEAHAADTVASATAPTTEASPSPADVESKPPPGTAEWLPGSWGIDGDCSNRMEIRTEGTGLQVSIAGNSRTLVITSAEAASIVTDEGTYARDGSGVTFSAGGTETRLVPCSQ